MRLGLCFWYYRNNTLVKLSFVEVNGTVYESVERVVLTNSYILAWVVLCTTLTNDDVTGNALLTTEDLDAKSLSC